MHIWRFGSPYIPHTYLPTQFMEMFLSGDLNVPQAFRLVRDCRLNMPLTILNLHVDLDKEHATTHHGLHVCATSQKPECKSIQSVSQVQNADILGQYFSLCKQHGTPASATQEVPSQRSAEHSQVLLLCVSTWCFVPCSQIFKFPCIAGEQRCSVVGRFIFHGRPCGDGPKVPCRV